MKPPLRIGILVLAVALALFMAAFLRAYSPVSFGATMPYLQPDQWRDLPPYHLSPQNLRIAFSTMNGTPVNIYILNSQEFQEWEDTGTLNAAISIENQSVFIGTFDIASRDFYTLIAHNPNNETEGIHIDLTLYGFEKDLTLTTTIIAVVGIVTPTIYYISGKAKAHSHKKEP